MITAVGSRVYSFGYDFHELAIDGAAPRDDGGDRRPFWCGVFADVTAARDAWAEVLRSEGVEGSNVVTHDSYWNRAQEPKR